MKMESSKLAKLRMPMKRKGMDLGAEGSPGEEAAESPEEEKQEQDAGMGDDSMDQAPDDQTADGHNDALTSVSDDDLLAEIKKRGLMSQLDKGSAAMDKGGESDQSMYT